MKHGFSVIDGSQPNFQVQTGLQNLHDGNGLRMGKCDKTGRSPIRAQIDSSTGKINGILCGAKDTCVAECPFTCSVEKDMTDFMGRRIA